MEAARPRRSRQYSKKKKQQQQQQTHTERDVAVSSSLTATDDARAQQPVDAAQRRTTRDSSSGSASSDTADEPFGSDTADVDGELMDDMLAAMAADIEPLSGQAMSSSSSSSRGGVVALETHATETPELETKRAALPVTDSEIAQNEDDLLSLLGAAPMTSDAPYESASSSELALQDIRVAASTLTIEIPAPRDASDTGGTSAASAAAEAMQSVLADPSSPDAQSCTESTAAHTPSAPAFDEDEHEQLPAPLRTLHAAAVDNAASSHVAPSAPHFPGSEDESVRVATPAQRSVTSAAVETPMRRLPKHVADTLVATGAPEGFPDSSPFGPRGTATPSAPPAISLDEPAASSDATDVTVRLATAAASAAVAGAVTPATSETNGIAASLTAGSNFAPSAPSESDTESSAAPSQPSTAAASTAPSAPLMPSLSPTAAKTISRTPRTDESTASAVSVTGAAVATTSSEGIGRTVRNTFAKARMLEASRNLYPSVPQQPSVSISRSGSGASRDGAADGHVIGAAVAPKRISIKLEPFVNFEMNLLRAEAAQKRQELKMQRIESNKGELFARLERYLFAEYLLHTAAASLESSKTEVESLMAKVWTLEVKRLSSSQRCGDHTEISQQLEFQTAKLEPQQLAKLKAHLDKLRQLRTVESSMHTFDRALAFFHVEQYLNGLLHEPHLVAFLNKMNASCASSNGASSSSVAGSLDVLPERVNFFETLPPGSTLASTVDHLKYCVDVLVYFEKKVTMNERGAFGRVPHSFFRGELVWHHANGKPTGGSGGGGMVRKIKCYACGCLNAPMEPTQCCKLCESCDVVLYLPPSSVATTSAEWYSSVVRFRESLQRWISACLQSLLRTKLLSNMPYVLMHIMYLPRIGTEERSWLLRFLQFPRAIVATDGSVRHAWSEDLVDHYLAMLHLVFHPEKLRRMSVLVSSGPPASALSSSSAPSATNGATESAIAVSPEWVLLENPEFLDRCFLSDDDFVAVLNQFPNTFAFEQLFACSFDAKKSFSRALTLVLELTQSLRAFQEFEKFPLRIAQLLGELLANASAVAISTAAASALPGDALYYPTLFDQLFVTALHGLLVADCNRVAWRSLSAFPFGALSALAKWDVLALLLFNIQNVPPEAKSVAGWMAFAQRAVSGSSTSENAHECATAARDALYDLIASDTENAVHLLHAVAHLAASCSGDESHALVSVAVHELFVAGYTVPACQRALGENGERAAVPISTICLAHPWIISSLIGLLFKYHECAATWIHVFETFPVNRWAPTPTDLASIQEWLLLENTSAPRCALARFLLDHINWEFDIHRGELFTGALLHRRVALIVAEAFVLYKTRRERASDPASAIVVSGGGAPQKLEVTAITKSIRRALWLEDTFDFPAWCWRLVLKLKFYSPARHEPFIELIDLARDRSREALTLRRWFANASKPVSVSVKRVPFYSPSGDIALTQLVVRSGKEQLAQDIAASHAMVGGTGAPIHEDSVNESASSAGAALESDKTSMAPLATVSATAAQTTEPIVAYLICQITTFVFSDRMDRWEPLLVLLKHGLFHATVRVLENVFPVLAKLDAVKRGGVGVESTRVSLDDADKHSPSAPDATEDTAEPQQRGRLASIDLEIESCMAAIETLSTSETLQLVAALFDNSYISADERSRIEDVLQRGYIGGWESTAKAKVHSKLRFVRECSRYVHPALLPALINEAFPRTSTAARTTSALFHGAMSWISSTLRGNGASAMDTQSPSAAASATAALAVRRSSIAGSVTATAPLGMLSVTTEYSTSTRALCSAIEREFEYSGADAEALRRSMRFWIKALLQVPYWFENHEFRHVLDVLVRCSMASHFTSASGCESSPASLPSSTSVLLYELVAELQAAFETLCLELKANREDPTSDASDAALVVSFLPPSDATALSSLFGSAFDAAQHVGGCSFLAFWSLLLETRQELPLFLAMGHLMLKYEPKTMTKIEKWKKTRGKLAAELALLGLDTAPSGSPSTPVDSKCFLYAHTSFDSLAQFKLYRWCEFCLEMPEHDDAQILYWQVFFALYFACAGGARIFGHYFLSRPGSRKPKRVHVRTNLQTKLRRMINYCSTQAQVVLTTTSGVGHAVASSAAAAETKERKYALFVTLAQLYTAMDAWLEEPDPNVWVKDDEFVTLPRHYEVKRLQDVLKLSDALLTPSHDAFDWSQLPLWTNLCGFEFTFHQSQSAAHTTTASDLTSTAAAASATVVLNRKKSDVLDEEEFAFVEDASDLRRRHSSFGSTFGGGIGDSVRVVQPLPLLPEHCGPATLTMLPLVSLGVSETSCVVTPSLQLNKPALRSVAVKFSENLSVLVALDAELLDHVAQLYVSKTRTVTQSIACLEGSSCRQPASFRFEFMEWAVDKALLDAAHAILTQSERCDMQAMLTNMTWTVMERHDAARAPAATAAVGSATGMTLAPRSADSFLKLDGDGQMLVMQILLIDEIVRTLDAELQNVRREQQAASANSDVAADTVKDASEPRADASSTDDAPSTEDSILSDASSVTALAPAKQWDKVLDRLHEKGLEWFRLLTELDTKLSRMVPPLREVLWRSIKQLGASFVCVDERETYSLLTLMLEDPSRIHLLSDCFYPAGAPSRFVEMFSKLMSASGSAKLATDEKLVLLQRFDFRAWLTPATSATPAPTKFDRETVLCIVLADISAQFPADRSLSSTATGNGVDSATAPTAGSGRNYADEVLRFYAQVVHLICSTHLEDHIEKVLHALVGVHDDYRFHSSHADAAAASNATSASVSASASLAALPRAVDAKIWDAIVSIPLDAWQRVPFSQLETCVAFLSQHVTSLRWQTALSSTTTAISSSASDKSAATAAQYPIVYWQQLGVLKYVLDLFTICCRVAPAAQQWPLITTFFEPLLATLYQPANTTESSSICSPWAEHDSFSTGTAVCSCFVAACTELLRAKKPSPSASSPSSSPTSLMTAMTATTESPVSDNTKLTQIWTFYLHVLVPHAPVHMCKHLHQFLTRLAWEHWCLTLEIVQQMRELVQRETQQLASSAESSSSYPYVSWLVRDILCRRTWHATDAWLGAQGETVTSLFLLEFAKLCVELVLDLPHWSPPPPRSRRAVLAPASSTVLPPYFVNFVKQQSALWAKWTLAPSDLDALLQFTLAAVSAPLQSNTVSRRSGTELAGAIFPAHATPAVLQDAFTRLQLVLRLLAQVTTLHHTRVTRADAFRRADQFLAMLYAVFELHAGAGDEFAFTGTRMSDPAAWLVVLQSASCTVFYDKLDEVVQLYRSSSDAQDRSNNSSGGSGSAATPTMVVSEDVLTDTLVGVLRFCNLSIVERFFKDEQSRRVSAPQGSPSSAVSLSWAKCGNVIFVEIDSLVRDFASASQKALLQSHRADRSDSDDITSAGGDASAGSSSSSSKLVASEAVGNRLGRVLWSFLAFRGGELCCLSSCGRAIASVHVMSQVAEKSIEKWIIEDRRGAWRDLVLRLRVPELSADEFERACVAQGNLLTLQVLFLQQLRRAPALTEALAMGMLAKLLSWLETLQLAGKHSLTEMKVLFLAAEATNFVCVTLAETLPAPVKKQMLRQVSAALLTMGHARKQHGIMKAIGMGGSLQYNAEFHVACLTVGVYLRLQTRASVPLRVDDRIALKLTRTSEKHLRSLEDLLKTKDCFQLGKRMDWLVDFVRSPTRSLADQDEFFVSLFSRLYPSHPWLLAKCVLA